MTATTDIISLWPSIEVFAEDAGVSVSLARVWKTRKSIPAERWAKIEAAAERRGIPGVTGSDLAKLIAQEVAA